MLDRADPINELGADRARRTVVVASLGPPKVCASRQPLAVPGTRAQLSA